MFEKLKKNRINRNISAEVLAKVLGLETKSAYYKKESGLVKFTLEDAKKLSEFFGLPIEKIFFADEVSE